ncbi:hypothetical protein DIRU0_D34178 [Diutina rugosa]
MMRGSSAFHKMDYDDQEPSLAKVAANENLTCTATWVSRCVRSLALIVSGQHRTRTWGSLSGNGGIVSWFSWCIQYDVNSLGNETARSVHLGGKSSILGSTGGGYIATLYDIATLCTWGRTYVISITARDKPNISAKNARPNA